MRDIMFGTILLISCFAFALVVIMGCGWYIKDNCLIENQFTINGNVFQCNLIKE